MSLSAAAGSLGAGAEAPLPTLSPPRDSGWGAASCSLLLSLPSLPGGQRCSRRAPWPFPGARTPALPEPRFPHLCLGGQGCRSTRGGPLSPPPSSLLLGAVCHRGRPELPKGKCLLLVDFDRVVFPGSRPLSDLLLTGAASSGGGAREGAGKSSRGCTWHRPR